METMEFSQQCGIEYVVPGHPGSLFQPISLPVNEVFQPATPLPRIQNVLDLVDGGLVQDFWRRRCLRLGGSWCRWREWFKEGNIKFQFQVLFVTYTTIQRLYNQQWNVSRVRSMDSANIEKYNTREVYIK